MIIIDSHEMIEAVTHYNQEVVALMKVIAERISNQINMIAFVAEAAKDVEDKPLLAKCQAERVNELIEEAEAADPTPWGPQEVWSNVQQMLGIDK